MKCQIEWIDRHGNPTPDSNPAIGFAVCYDPISFPKNGSRKIPICKKHFLDMLPFQHWKMKPLPKVESAIAEFAKSHNLNLQELLNKSIYNTLGDYWSFHWNNMLIGVEQDGHIHS